jgi:hypothetical protein
MEPSIGQRGIEAIELLGGQRGEKFLDGGKLQLSPQQPRLPPGSINFQRHQPCPGFAVFGHHDCFAGMGGVDQPGELGLGLVNIDGAHGGLQP